jgi:glycosyltransferase involved in cell wall biosynthesis
LTVVGDGEDLPACKAEARRLGIEDRVRFLGWRQKAEVEQHYRHADIFLFPSYREPTGGVLLEAMAHGLPTITCAYGGADYLISDACGVKVKPTGETEFVIGLAQAIDTLVSDGALRRQMRQNALLRVKNEFGWAEKRKRIINLYRSVIEVATIA